MLRRADNVGISHSPGFFTGNGWVMIGIGRSVYRLRKVHKAEYDQMLRTQQTYPLATLLLDQRVYWLFQGTFYWENEGLTADQVYALLVTRQQRRTQQIERAQAMVVMGQEPRPTQRGAIPDDVKQLVWIRDQGRCCHCGNTSELQFDHVIPLSKGGSSDPANLQILCGPCNRRKSAGLTVG